jgi:hypothetical protein
MRAIRFGGECPASIVAKKRQLRKRAEEVDVQVNFSTTGSTKEHRVKEHRVKPILPVFPCSSVLPVVKRFDEQKFRRQQRDNLIHSGPLKPAVRADSIRSGVDSYSYQKNSYI